MLVMVMGLVLLLLMVIWNWLLLGIWLMFRVWLKGMVIRLEIIDFNKLVGVVLVLLVDWIELVKLGI